MKAKQIKYYLPLEDNVIIKGHKATIYVWYKDGENAFQLMPYRLQLTSQVTRVLKNGTFYTLNSKFIPRRLN